MVTFLIAFILLIASYFIYGKFVEIQFRADPRKETPAIVLRDDIDFIPLKPNKIFLIQFLNIAGLGPIFGAISGALWGPVAFIWIVAGTIFIGSVHDYFSGMLSVRHKGKSIPEIVGTYLGKAMQYFMRIFTVILLILVGVVFVKGPASILTELTGIKTSAFIIAIFFYYFLATMLPVDKLIGKIYPFFGLSLLIMALSILIVLVFGQYKIPELIPANIRNMHLEGGRFPIFPLLFITIACGAISGFHSTQSPLMARCLPNEKDGKKIFFGAMVAEGIVALIWAAAAMAFFGGVEQLGKVMAEQGNNAAWVVNKICDTMLGRIGSILAIVGVVAAPITSGDTAFRSARITIADSLNLNQKRILKRFLITIPIFIIGFALTRIDFGIIWRYFGWANQTLATIVLWTATSYQIRNNRNFWFIIIPATFMTAVVISYIFIAPEGFHLPKITSFIIAFIVSLAMFAGYVFVSFRIKLIKIKTKNYVKEKN